MRCVVFTDGQVGIGLRPVPVAGAHEILVRVESASLNGADALQRRGLYPPPPGFAPDVPGLEFCGRVEWLGAASTRFAVGDRVMGIVGGAAQAEYVVLHERQAVPVPDALDTLSAGAFSEIFMTAYQALFDQAAVSIGDRVLVNGAAGGVGTAAVQLALAAGASVVASARNSGAHDFLQSLGAVALDPDAAFAAGPFDIVIETVGAGNLKPDLKALRRGGHVVVIGVGAGAKTELNLLGILNSSATVSGTTLRSMPLEEKCLLARKIEAQVLPLVEAGTIRVPLEEAFDLDSAAAAYEHFTRPGKLGKVVLRLGELETK